MKNIHKIRENIYITNSEEIKEGDWFISGGLVNKAIDIIDCDDDGMLEIHSEGYCNPLSLTKKNHPNNRPRLNQKWCTSY
jgi:hypothetical protein